jgi:hypothetical protein
MKRNVRVNPTVLDVGRIRRRISDPAPIVHRPPTKRYSSWLLTVSTNYRPKDNDEAEEIKYKLEDTLYEIFNSEELTGRILKFLNGGNISQIEDVWTEISVELGSHAQGGRVHAHVRASFAHFTRFHVSSAALRDLVKEMMNDNRIKGIYVHFQFVKTPHKYIDDYLRKDVPVE